MTTTFKLRKSYAMVSRTRQGDVLLHFDKPQPESITLSVGDNIHVVNELQISSDEDHAKLIVKILERVGYRRVRE